MNHNYGENNRYTFQVEGIEEPQETHELTATHREPSQAQGVDHKYLKKDDDPCDRSIRSAGAAAGRRTWHPAQQVRIFRKRARGQRAASEEGSNNPANGDSDPLPSTTRTWIRTRRTSYTRIAAIET